MHQILNLCGIGIFHLFLGLQTLFLLFDDHAPVVPVTALLYFLYCLALSLEEKDVDRRLFVMALAHRVGKVVPSLSQLPFVIIDVQVWIVVQEVEESIILTVHARPQQYYYTSQLWSPAASHFRVSTVPSRRCSQT